MRIVRCLQAGLAIAAWLLGAAAAAQVIDAARLAHIDAHALAAPPEVEASPQQLARYLVQPAQNDAEKARAIFRWIADRIHYDVNAYFGAQLDKVDAAQVLAQRGAVCDGYATLFEALGREAGLEVISIKGYAKAYGYFPGQVLDKPNHAWNAVKIDGRWRLLDATWGAGYVRDGRYVKTLSEVFFLAAPEQLMFSHFPEDEHWQLQATPHLTKPQFEAMPTLEPAFFHTGISGEQVWQTLQRAGFKGSFVRTFDMPYRMVQVQQAPLAYHLGLNQPQNFCIQTGAFEKMSVLLNDQWTEMQKQGDVFTLNFTPAANGTLMVVGKKPEAGNYTAILSYVVE